MCSNGFGFRVPFLFPFDCRLRETNRARLALISLAVHNIIMSRCVTFRKQMEGVVETLLFND